jgi:hypothetical protein
LIFDNSFVKIFLFVEAETGTVEEQPVRNNPTNGVIASPQ